MTGPFVNMKVKALFFDSPKVKRAVNRAKRGALSKSGRDIRILAKRAMEQSVRGGRLKESDLPTDLRRRRKIANIIRKRQGKPRLKPLHKPSRPGHAPAARRSSPLNRLLFFAYDPSADSVVVGPVGFGASKAPSVLEFGGTARIGKRNVRITPRPYMSPALKKELPQIPKAWANSVRGG